MIFWNFVGMLIGYAIAGAAFRVGGQVVSGLFNGDNTNTGIDRSNDEELINRRQLALQRERELENKRKELQIKIDHANELLETGHYERAKNSFESVIEDIKKMEHGESYKLQIQESIKKLYERLAEQFREKGAYNEAIDCYQKLIGLEGETNEICVNLGNLYYAMGASKYIDAIKYYKKAIEKDRSYRFGYERLGELYEKTGRIKDAQDIYLQAARNYPNDESFQLHFYKKALSIGNVSIDIKKEIIQIYLKKGMYSEALKFIDEIINSDPNRSENYYDKGFCLQKLGNISEAINILEKAIKLQSNFEDAHYLLAIIYEEQKNYDRCIAHLQKITKSRGLILKTNLMKAKVFFEKKNIDVALKVLDKIDDSQLKRDLKKYELKDVIELFANLGNYYKDKKDDANAHFCLNRAEKLDKRIFKELANPKKAGLMNTFWDKYKFISEIGVGGMARVLLGIEQKTSKKVAIKEMLPTLTVDPIVVERFRREVKIMKELDHPNIIKIFDDALWEDKYLFVMEYINGMSLAEYIGKKSPIQETEFVRIIKGVAMALSYMHKHPKKIIHRDLKPDNILLRKDLTPVLTDFGLARTTVSSSSSSSMLKLTKSKSYVGTPYFSSPEQFFDSKNVTSSTDIYSLGCIMFNMVAQFPPYMPNEVFELPIMHRDAAIPDPRKINPDVSDKYAEMIMKCLAKKPEDRFQSTDEIIGILGGDSKRKIEISKNG